MLIAVLAIVGVLLATGTSYQTYFEGAQFVHFLLGLATVALAIPLYRQLDHIRKSGAAILASIDHRPLSATLSAIAIVWGLGGSPVTVISTLRHR